uniref:Uncharacterized protein n=1 Tax=Arundo donax TaxID=35708 RepID=A0A0A9E198_ARUDO
MYQIWPSDLIQHVQIPQDPLVLPLLEIAPSSHWPPPGSRCGLHLLGFRRALRPVLRRRLAVEPVAAYDKRHDGNDDATWSYRPASAEAIGFFNHAGGRFQPQR